MTGKVYKLNMAERFAILSALPNEGSFMTLRVLRDLKAKLAPSPSELTEFEMVQSGDRVRMNDKASEARDVEIGEREEDQIFIALQNLNRTDKLKEHQMSVYEKFVEARK